MRLDISNEIWETDCIYLERIGKQEYNELFSLEVKLCNDSVPKSLVRLESASTNAAPLSTNGHRSSTFQASG